MRKDIKYADATLKKLKVLFVLHCICNLALVGIIVYNLTDGFSIVIPLAALGVSMIATGITCVQISKRYKYLETKRLEVKNGE